MRFKAHGDIKGTFAIDDIKLRPGRCNHQDNYVYTFDMLDGLEVFRMKPLGSIVGIVLDTSLKNIHYPYAPNKDHTTGDGSYFLFMNQANSELQTEFVDWLVIDNLPKMNFDAKCVKFAFQVYENATLRVGVVSLYSNELDYAQFVSTS